MLPEEKPRPAAEVNHTLWEQGYLFCVPAEACIDWKWLEKSLRKVVCGVVLR